MSAYHRPKSWIEYDILGIASELIEAKSIIKTLKNLPFLREWADKFQQMELKREIAGTTKIEGAAFTEREFEEALSESTEEFRTRSQRQVRAMLETYKWISTVPDNKPVTAEMILEIHRKIITGADDDHCLPGKIRDREDRVLYGIPRRQGMEGGTECMIALVSLTNAFEGIYKDHDPLIQAFAAHYHLGAIHPFMDGNGRTARALEALFLRRADLKGTVFVAMSNYYYEERNAYFRTLSEVGDTGHDLTAFLKFSLKGIALQCEGVIGEIKLQSQKALFRNLMYDLFNRLLSTRKRVIAKRQIAILNLLLKEDRIKVLEIFERTEKYYGHLSSPVKAYFRDMDGLLELGAIRHERGVDEKDLYYLNLDWPMEITETGFMEAVKKLPKAKGSISLT
ncbi:Fic family protein [bacterium]|nr:Fic family protein [bacterium]